MPDEERPIITCAGNQNFFSSVHPYMVDALALKLMEWQRSYSRPLKQVRLRCSFVPYDVHQLPRSLEENRLLKDPMLHLYWIDCDMETYKKKVRDDLFMWQSALKALSIPDWLIIVVTHDENKVKTKILRTSLYDKVKNEFNSKSTNRCVLFSEPFQNDTKGEAWLTVTSRIQELLLVSFNRLLSRYEDNVRLERERRNESDWTFSKYFVLQEELAKFYDVVELFDEALVQYDELDALFAQFVVNNSVGAKADWLTSYSHIKSGWDGMSMSRDMKMYRRILIAEGKCSLLDIRNYLFSKQCELLVKLGRPAELTSRSLKFVHNTIQEMRLLGMDIPDGAVSCWVFLTCKELLDLCEPFKEKLGMEAYSSYTSPLWSCLQSVTYKLGCLCGLMPETKPTSGHESVEQLIAGITVTSQSLNSYGLLYAQTAREDLSPRDKLKTILSSEESFCQYYVELTEMTMGTLKYVGRIRMAKILGQQLSQFYMNSERPQQAEPFLLNCLQLFSNERWTQLELDTWKQLADCEERLGNFSAFVKACLKIASHKESSESDRLLYAQKVIDCSATEAERLMITDENTFTVKLMSVINNPISSSSKLNFSITSDILLHIPYHSLTVFVKRMNRNYGVTNRRRSNKSRTGLLYPIVLLTSYSYENEDNELAIGLECANTHALLSQKDSQANSHMIRNLSVNELDSDSDQQEIAIGTSEGNIFFGENAVAFEMENSDCVHYTALQLRIELQNMDIYIPIMEAQFSVNGKEPPSLEIDSASACYMGVRNCLRATVINYSPGLSLSFQCEKGEVTHTSSTQSPSELIISLVPHADIISGSHSIYLQSQFKDGAADYPVASHEILCSCPLETQSKVYTAGEKKFIQVAVFSLAKDKQLTVRNPRLDPVSPDVTDILSSLNGSDSKTWSLVSGCMLCFAWRLESVSSLTEHLKCVFSLEFSESESSLRYQSFCADVNLDVVKSCFTITRYIKPGLPMSPSTLSRQSSIDVHANISDNTKEAHSLDTWQAFCECEMAVELCVVNRDLLSDDVSDYSTISYEVITDPSWAISGNKTGFLQLKDVSDRVTIAIKIMPLVGGFLYLPEVRLRNSHNEEFLPGQVYDASKLNQVFVNNLEE